MVFLNSLQCVNICGKEHQQGGIHSPTKSCWWRTLTTAKDLYDPNNACGIGKGTQGIRQSGRPLLPTPAVPQRNQTIEFLFELYDKYTTGMFQPVKKGKKKESVVISKG